MKQKGTLCNNSVPQNLPINFPKRLYRKKVINMNSVSENNNLVKTLRNDPNGFVIFGDSIIKYCKDKKDEYLVSESVANNSIKIEKIEVAQ